MIGLRDRILTLRRKNKVKINKVGKYLQLGGDESSEFADLIGEVINTADELR